MRSKEVRDRISRTCKLRGVGRWIKGRTPWNKGLPVPIELKKRISESLKGRKMPYVSEANKRRVYSEKTRKLRSNVIKRTWQNPKFRNMHESKKGDKSPVWIKDRTLALEKARLRSSNKWKSWRVSIFKRDGYSCQECGQVGGYLEPHHIIPVRKNIKSKFLFNKENGITLCRPCHRKTVWKEDGFAERYLFKIGVTLDRITQMLAY